MIFDKEDYKAYDADLWNAIAKEEERQQNNIELIASENVVSKAVMAAQGSILTNKYAEGYPGRRYYGGTDVVDVVESLAIERAKEIFGAKFANVQPHSGSQANCAESVLEIVAKIEEADGVIIGTPEYDHSIPAVLMSALAWLSYGVFPLLNKPVMITGASYGTLGSSRAQLQLRQILNAPEIKANVLPDEFLLSHSLQAFDQNGDLVDLDVIQKLDAVFNDFRVFVKITDKLRNAQELLRKDAEEFDWENL